MPFLSVIVSSYSVSFYSVLVQKTDITPRLPMIHHSSNGRFAIRSGKWKLVMNTKKDKRELYDLETDPAEAKDVAAQHADVVRNLTKQISDIVTNGRTTPGRKQSNDTPPWSDLTWMK